MYNLFHGEYQQQKYVDQTLREYFPDYNYKGIFLDIGAYEPINISNSYHFEQNNWDVYCFEANTMLIDGLKKHRKNVFNYAVYNENKPNVEFNVVKAGYGGGSGMAGISAVELSTQYLNTFYRGEEVIKINVEQKTMNDILDNIIQLKTDIIDIVSIDVEGGELKVLEGFNLNKYKVKIFVIENVFNDPTINDYLKQYGYVLDKRIDYNEYYKCINLM
jgi:FkbM family methyltransferase